MTFFWVEMLLLAQTPLRINLRLCHKQPLVAGGVRAVMVQAANYSVDVKVCRGVRVANFRCM